MGLTIAIPTIGRPVLLARCIAAVRVGLGADDTVLVLDQDAGSGTADVVAAAGDDRVVRLRPARRGISVAMNLALREAADDVVVVTHDDCVAAADWVPEARALAATFPGSIVTGQVRPPDGATDVPSCKVDADPQTYSRIGDFGQLYPNNMVLPRTAALDLGGFDERFTSAAEDLDFSLRWLRSGGRLHYAPQMVVTHHDWRPPEELAALYKRYWHEQGRFYGKHLRAGERDILPYVLHDLRAAVAAGLQGVTTRRPAWQDARRGAIPALPLGVARGLWRFSPSRP